MDTVRELSCKIVDLFDELLCDENIVIPCADKDEEEERHYNNISTALYGLEYHNLVDKIEELINANNEDNKIVYTKPAVTFEKKEGLEVIDKELDTVGDFKEIIDKIPPEYSLHPLGAICVACIDHDISTLLVDEKYFIDDYIYDKKEEGVMINGSC